MSREVPIERHRYRRSDKWYGYPSGVKCRFCTSHYDICMHRDRRTKYCINEDRRMNVQNGFACEKYRGTRSAHLVCDKCYSDMFCIDSYRMHCEGFSVFKCERCGRTEEYS